MANKKINQLVSKTAILSTDLFGIGDATTGQLFKKTIAELQAAIGGAVISVNGLVGTVVLDTDDIQELATPTNKYFTDARARAAISLTVTGNSGASTYSSGTGVLNVPTYTLAGLGGITASFLSGTSGISYNSTTGVISYSGTVYTDASIRALLSGSTGISYNSTTGAISYSGTVYTDSSVRALISITTTGTSGASTYNNTTGVINVPNYTLAGLGGISLTSLSGGTGITYNSSTGAISYSGTVYTDASVRALISASGAVSYNNTTGVISLTSGNLTEATSSVLTITGGTGAVLGSGTSIQVKQATTSVSGFLSSTDWTTFNNKQATVSLTTTGTSGAATFSANTLNIPNYGSALSGYLPLTGGTLTGALVGTSATFTDRVYASKVVNSSTISNSTSDASLLLYAPTTTNYYGGIIGWAEGNLAASISAYDDGSGGALGLSIATGNNTSISERLKISSTGAATFSSSVTANAELTLSSTGTAFVLLNNTTATTGKQWRLSSGSNGSFFITQPGVADVLTLAPTTGAATFSSSVSATSLRSSAVGTFGFNTANNGEFQIYATASDGLVMSGRGSTNDFVLVNKTGSNVFEVPTGTINTYFRGNVGIGTSSPTWLLEIYKDTTSGSEGVYPAISVNNPNAAGYTGYYFYSTTQKGGIEYSNSTNSFLFYANSAERMRITSGGNILMGTTTDNGERLYVSGAIRATGTITANSDITLKKNLLKIENALEKVEQINGYTYEFKADDSKRHAGVIAQEIQTVLPEIVNKGNDGILGVEYGNISALLIEAIKEQNIKIKNLETLLASK